MSDNEAPVDPQPPTEELAEVVLGEVRKVMGERWIVGETIVIFHTS